VRIKKEIPIILCLFVVTTFILVRAGIFTSSEARVCVDPTEKTVHPYDTFTINVNVTSVPAIEAYSFIIYYDTIPVDGVSVELPSGHFFEPREHEDLLITQMGIDDNYNATHGRVSVTVRLVSNARRPAPTCKLQNIRQVELEAWRAGSGILFTITFNCTGRGISVLNLHQVILFQHEGASISHSQIHGLINAHS
jgi:hypothetical protein